MQADAYQVIHTPQLGVNDPEVTITRWYVANGAGVRRGQSICGLETTKATFDVEAESDGVFLALHPAGATLRIDEPLGVVFASTGVYEQLRDQLLAASAKRAPDASSPRATVKAAKLAEALHVDLASLPTRGIIRERDVERFARSRSAAVSSPVEFREGVTNVAIWGSGRGAYTLWECVQVLPGWRVACYLDDDPSRAGELDGVPVLPSTVIRTDSRFRQAQIATEIADSAVRARIVAECDVLGIRVATVVHPSATVSPSARVGRGCFIKAGAVIETRTVVGEGCIIDNGVVIPHDNHIDQYCHLAPRVVLGSGVSIGAHTVVGIGASIATGITVGSHCIVGVGAGVTRNVPDHTVVEGVPARVIGRRVAHELS